jgi:alpha-D-xyloside xylohydrolase
MKAAPDQRAFLLTRSGYAGEHRYSTATWSGDITSTWTAMARQIPAGLGFSISGEPYWTMDTGGFSVPSRFGSRNPKPEDLDEWRELNARWFEFGTFVPLLRVHGEFPYREMWQFGGETSPAYAAMLKFDRLRYRLMPYIYSMAGDVAQKGATIMRPLAMDYPDDARARDLTDQFMFGKSLMVSPVTQYQARSREVYLPKGRWYDFWTGKVATSGETPAPYDAIPLHVPAGSIIPVGPEQQYVGEKPAGPITLYIYAGKDADFSLYEDDGLTNAYQRGQWSRIPIHWKDSRQQITFGARIGGFPGMVERRQFNLVLVRPDNPVGFFAGLNEGSGLEYRGRGVTTWFLPLPAKP